ncbi:hypothetical protein GGTG_02238 [Gaeumannomyces tritici R3-111a-1]|uniref:Uncharacterized protein n=1 Tax=Gaeumannomyces tritici (strain R3-111a-1) TaxID=644352 RepID=J3NLT8_GAET3|nr:hypothetical protein GGTG_02238 [Gaeumannomyces tritici R3-111a-1]EJT82264.1 hypothetical protein GGTG_02238 [Gaeumannomyces tritici R3-111a-1]
MAEKARIKGMVESLAAAEMSTMCRCQYIGYYEAQNGGLCGGEEKFVTVGSEK